MGQVPAGGGAPGPQGAFAGAQYLMGLQLFVRLATFSTNTAVLYIAGRRAFGVASVRFELLLSTILFLSREGMRNALLRVAVADRSGSEGSTALRTSQNSASTPAGRPSAQEQRIINAALVPIAAGMGMAGCLYAAYVGRSAEGPEPQGPGSVPYYRLSLAVYIVAAWIELCVEPLFVLSRARVLFRLQAKCEGIAVSCRCAAVVAALLAGRLVAETAGENPLRLLAFAVGQLAYATAILLAFAWHMARELDYPVWMCYVPRAGPRPRDGTQRSGAIGGLAAVLVGQSLLKHFLTQGDSMVMARFATADEMGVFAFVSNYGSIPARIVFLPLEEASRAVFSRMAPSQPPRHSGGTPSAGSAMDVGDAEEDGTREGDARGAAHILATLGKLQLLLGLLLVAFGPLYAPVLLSLIRQNDPAVRQALVAYCFYLPLLGLNGFVEAFVHSVASRRQLLRINMWMVVFTAVYMTVAVLALCHYNLGSAGIIAANMLNMALRVAYGGWFIFGWYAQRHSAGPRLAAMLPHPAVAGACLASSVTAAAAMAATGAAQNLVLCRLTVLALGAALGAAVLVIVWRYEQPFIRSVQALRTGQPLHAKVD
ncbi:Oligosaccharide translocation protein rft1 [Coemansia biformis]|uniref:Man(5)GlcNAc(2)-PP-dolichol translocation protein RFT1 n=1 Tax=Coemansia biformis TaxID=1286918 RepID=A0A9W7YI70_9FUNG|nr:Oligosaccharide translocation protein rft1 [Coemansia biformis]